MDFTITLEQMEFFNAAVIERDRLRVEKREAEDALRRKRQALRNYQAICEARKREGTSGAGASAEPRENEANADEPKAAAVLLTNETEGRGSGGERADNGRAETELERADDVLAELKDYVFAQGPGDEYDDDYLVECCDRIFHALERERAMRLTK